MAFRPWRISSRIQTVSPRLTGVIFPSIANSPSPSTTVHTSFRRWWAWYVRLFPAFIINCFVNDWKPSEYWTLWIILYSPQCLSSYIGQHCSRSAYFFMFSLLFFSEIKIPSFDAAITKSLVPIHIIGRSNSLMICVFSASPSVITLPITWSSNSSVSVFQVPKSFHLPEKGTTATNLAFSATS